jgi:integrase
VALLLTNGFLDELIASRSDVKPATLITYENVKRNLIDCFGSKNNIRDITPGDADAFRLWLITHEGLAENTVRRRTGIARQFLKSAARRKMIDANPFDGLPASVRRNPDRFRFITRDEAVLITDACPDAEWRTIFALGRFGGLRCPSEHLALKWSDVDWARNRITIHSPKTEHHPDGKSRVIPLFPELLAPLRDLFESAEPGAEHIIKRYREPGQNLRTQFSRIIRKAGLSPWPKPFQNL